MYVMGMITPVSKSSPSTDSAIVFSGALNPAVTLPYEITNREIRIIINSQSNVSISCFASITPKPNISLFTFLAISIILWTKRMMSKRRKIEKNNTKKTKLSE
jgi:hypothetical protein